MCVGGGGGRVILGERGRGVVEGVSATLEVNNLVGGTVAVSVFKPPNVLANIWQHIKSTGCCQALRIDLKLDKL